MGSSQTFHAKVAFVTGGGTGIGRACAERLVEGGAVVGLAGRRAEVLEKAAAELGGGAVAVPCDATSQESVDGAVERLVREHGGLHLAVNSAGVGGAGGVLNSTDAEFTQILDTNLVGAFRCMRAEARAMKRAGGGAIVNISSIAGALTHPEMTAYCCSKAGVNMLTRCAADDLGRHGIRVNALMPGIVRTDLAEPLWSRPAVVEEYLRRMPLARLGEPADVAGIAAFLLSDDASWITGQCFGVDGGHTIRQGPDLVEPLIRTFFPEER